MSSQISKSLKIRILSGAILAPVIIGFIFYGGWPFIILVIVAALLSLYEWYNMAKSTDHTVRYLLLGVIYLSICFSSFLLLRLFHTQDAVWLALSIALCVWSSDIGAYFAGKKIGGAKLAPVISPQKTWAGFFGAMIFGGLVLGLLLSSPLYFVAGCFLGAVGQLGDLLMSAMKRCAGVKDTGTLIPGHGGLLDRIDALLLAVPCFTVIVMIWPP